jgi:hypothetical protein|tara:strand:+ start:787 stop:2049 length:1263 start_codon:yes stop_codon:yes gene_type:complete
MAVHDYILSNQSGSSFRSDLNNALAAIVSQNSSATAPATTYSYQYWVDTSATPALIKQRNSANDAWVTLAEVDGQILAADGTDAKPGISFASDINTGLKRNAANDVSIVTGGTQALTVKSDQKVGINTTAPGGPLEVQTATSERVIFDSAGSQQPRIKFVRDSGADYSITNAAGELLIERDSSEIYKFVAGERHVFTGLAQVGKYSDWWSAGTFYGISGIGHIGSEGSFRLTLTSNGYRDADGDWVSLGINSQNGASQIGLDPSGQIIFAAEATKNTGAAASVTERARFLNTGQFRVSILSGSGNADIHANSSGVLFRSSSDGTLKENVTTLGSQLENIKALNPVSYNWIDTDFYGTQTEIGFIAQEVQPLIPEVVSTNSDNKLGINYSILTATLTKALQEAIAKIETLETKVAALEAAN